jgi:hypothetical protein
VRILRLLRTGDKSDVEWEQRYSKSFDNLVYYGQVISRMWSGSRGEESLTITIYYSQVISRMWSGSRGENPSITLWPGNQSDVEWEQR